MTNTSSSQAANAVHYLQVEESYAGQRIDNFLIGYLKGAPRGLIYRILRKGEVRVNKGRVKPEYRLQGGDIVRIPPVRLAGRDTPPVASEELCAFLERQILFENRDIIAINKPAGLAVHGGSGINLGLIEALRQARRHEKHLELVHRLDRETSGCLLIAKKRRALKGLQDALRQQQVKKYYLALVVGEWPKAVRQVDAPLLKYLLPSGERRVKVSEDGKPSQTAFEIKQRFEGYTLLEARPLTGRTHQIRVHARHVGCPLVGDDKYNDDGAHARAAALGFKRLFLHATQLTFPLPASDDVNNQASDTTLKTVQAPLPDDLTLPLKALQKRDQ